MPKAALKYADLTPQPAIHTPDPLCITGYVGWANLPEKGRGVIALKDMTKHTVCERCPVLVMPWSDFNYPEGQEPLIDSYLLRWGPEKEHGKSEYVCLSTGGHLTLYNHSNTPNIALRQLWDKELMEVYALRDIARGEELTFHYDCELWFDAR